MRGAGDGQQTLGDEAGEAQDGKVQPAQGPLDVGLIVQRSMAATRSDSSLTRDETSAKRKGRKSFMRVREYGRTLPFKSAD